MSKTVIEMVREAGGVIWSDKSASMHRTELERFAELVASLARADAIAKEREACAALAEKEAQYSVATAIRARGQE